MRIKELQLIGFKSFQEKATLRFAPGMNAVIGPNGCGKTNILDALRWVLGEQSFVMLRCKKNEDLIFGGTETVPGLNYAEVRLVMEADENEQGPGGGDQGSGLTEVEIRRRYFRSGESEYYLNKQACRLRDIQDVFFSAGAGTKAYSIFDLHQMREIISGNIRKMFEEASSLAKYQEAKAECQRKLALTESDLTRLDDIVNERERIVRSLQRQAGKLRAFDRLKDEEKGLRLLELKDEYDAVRRDLERAQADATALEQAEATRVTEIHRLEEELKLQRGRVRDLQAHKDDLALKIQDQRKAVSDIEGQNLLARQRIEFLSAASEQALAEKARLEESVAQLEATFNATLGKLTEANEALARAQAKLDRQRDETRDVEQKLYGLRSHDAALRSQLHGLLEEQNRAQQDLARQDAAGENVRETMQRLDAEMAGVRERAAKSDGDVKLANEKIAAVAARIDSGRKRLDGLRIDLAACRDARNKARADAATRREERAELEKELAVLRAAIATEQAEVSREVIGEALISEVSKLLEVSPGWERAAEAALYPVVDFLVTADVPAGKIGELAAKRPDLRFGFLTADGVARDMTETREGSRIVSQAGVSEPADDPSVLGSLLQFVKMKDGAPAAIGAMLSRCLAVSGSSELERLSRAYPGWSFVTQDGVCRFSDGRLVIEGRERGRLSVEALVRDRAGRAEATAAEVARLTAEEIAQSKRREELEAETGRVEFETGDAEREKASLDASVLMVAAAGEELQRDYERFRAEHRSADAQSKASEEKRRQLSEALAATADKVAATEAALKAGEAEVAALEAQVKAGLDLSAQALAEQSEARQAASRLEAENAFARRNIDDGRRRAAEFEAAVARNREEATGLEAAVAGRAGDVEGQNAALKVLEDEAAKLQITELARAEEALEANLSELRQSQERNQSILVDQRMKLYELNQKLGAIAEEASSSYATDIATFQPEQAEGVAERLAQVRRKIEMLGQVNPLAGDEYKQEKTDLEKLMMQREDVAQARVNLIQTMTEIDRHAQEQFAQTYTEVRGHFREIFRALFLEGEADLVMVDEANPLESEIGIIAKPRGKNPKRLEQLSDGEKALLAVSLLFAFYRVKPAPFCFLDEVDAPLDDANVGRFADYLRGISDKTQVVIITHNRLSVERADVVFGVTAEQPGISKLVSVSLSTYREQNAPPAN